MLGNGFFLMAFFMGSLLDLMIVSRFSSMEVRACLFLLASKPLTAWSVSENWPAREFSSCRWRRLPSKESPSMEAVFSISSQADTIVAMRMQPMIVTSLRR